MDAKQEHNLMNKFKKYIKNIKKGTYLLTKYDKSYRNTRKKKNVKEERHFQNYNFNNFINCNLLTIYV